MSGFWKNLSPNHQSFQTGHININSNYSAVPNFPWGNRIAPGQAPAIITQIPPDRINAYGIFSMLPGLLKITS